MKAADRDAWIVYNGEIYNFRELRGELEEKGYRFVQYWKFRFQPDSSLKARAGAEELSARLEEAVSSHLVGAFLSGGIDSSAVVAAMARCSGEPVRTYTAGYREVEFDQSLVARRSARDELDLDVLLTLDQLVAPAHLNPTRSGNALHPPVGLERKPPMNLIIGSQVSRHPPHHPPFSPPKPPENRFAKLIKPNPPAQIDPIPLFFSIPAH